MRCERRQRSLRGRGKNSQQQQHASALAQVAFKPAVDPPRFHRTGYSQRASGALPQFRSAFGCLRVVAPPEYLTRTLSSFTSWLCLCQSPVLHLCHLESGLVVPMWVDRAELPCNPVVLSHKQGVHHGEDLRWKAL